MRIYIGPFQWRERISSKTGLPNPAGVFGWRMPVGATQAFDLRGPKGAEIVDGFSPTKAIFICPDSVILAPPYVQVASDPDEILSGASSLLMDNIFERTLTSPRFLDRLHEGMTQHSDLSKTVTCPPRLAGRGGKIKWNVGGFTRETLVGIGTPEWLGVKARHQEVYASLRLQGGVPLVMRNPDLHRKYLATLMVKYKLTDTQVMEEFIPTGFPQETPIQPATTLTESFPGTSDTFGGDQTWTEVSGDWDNTGGLGMLSTINSTSHARCEGTLSTDDMRVTLTISAEGANPFGSAAARFAAAATTHYLHNSNRSANDYYCTRYLAGSGTDIIISELAGSITLPTTDKIEVDGDQVEIFEGTTTSRGSTTDTNISGNVRGGVGWYHEGTDTRFDNWQAEDLAAGGAAQMFLLTPVRTDGVGHGGIFPGGRL